MPRVSDEYRLARKRQIADAAVRQILKKGVHGTTLTNITEESGLSMGAIYTHFASKDEIISFVASSAINTILSDVYEVTEVDPLPSPFVLLEHMTENIQKATDPRLIVQMWSEAITDSKIRGIANEVFNQAREALREYFMIWLVQSRDYSVTRARAESEPAARAIVSLVYSYAIESSLLDGFDRDNFLTDVRCLASWVADPRTVQG